METKKNTENQKFEVLMEKDEFLRKLGINAKGKIINAYARVGYGDDESITFQVEIQTADILLGLDYSKNIEVAK